MMTFRVTEIVDLIIEVEQVETGHRMTFCLMEDRADISRGSFRENPGVTDPISKHCWRAAYLHARRAAVKAGLLLTATARQAGVSEGGRLLHAAATDGIGGSP